MTPRRLALAALALASAVGHLVLWLQYEDARRGHRTLQAQIIAHRCDQGGRHA